MTRQIICEKCYNSLRKLFPTDNPYDLEHIKFVPGSAKADYVCDNCNCGVLTGAECYAFSAWHEKRGIPYYPWEAEYIAIDKDQASAMAQ